MLSMQYQPRSSSMLSATLLPDPDRPLTTTRRVMWLLRSVHPAARDFSGVMVDQLFLVLANHAVELVGEGVDRGVHVGVLRVGVDHRATHADRRLGLVLQLLDGQDAAHVDDSLEMAQYAVQLPADVLAQRWRNLDVMAGKRQLHVPVLRVACRSFRRSAAGTLPARARGRDAERLAVLGHGAPRDLHAVGREHLHDLLVRKRLAGRFAGDQPPDFGTDRSRRNAGAAVRRHLAREEEPELEDAARRV